MGCVIVACKLSVGMLTEGVRVKLFCKEERGEYHGWAGLGSLNLN